MHKICDSCYNKLKAGKQCPHGSCAYDKPPRRNRDLENIIQKSDFGLKCSNEGCQVELTREELMKHEKKCEFRKVPCPFIDCSKWVIVRYLGNCSASHSPNTIKDEFISSFRTFGVIEEIVGSPDLSWVPRICIDPAGGQFLIQLSKRSGLWDCWVTAKTDPEAAAKLRCSIKIEKAATGMKIEFSGVVVHPIDASVEEILASGDFVVMHQENIEKLKVKCDVSPFSHQVKISFNVVQK